MNTPRNHFVQTYAATYLAALAAQKTLSGQDLRDADQPVDVAYALAETAWESYKYHHTHQT